MAGTCRYAKCYCEENIYVFLQDDHRYFNTSHEVYAVFISNDIKTVEIHCQTASSSPDIPVYWDYHVIALAMIEQQWFVFDFDSTLRFPTPATTYFHHSFPRMRMSGSPFQPGFRVVSREYFLAHFASDRSHMKDKDTGTWLAPPPTWAVLQGIASTTGGMNLHDWTAISTHELHLDLTDEEEEEANMIIEEQHVFPSCLDLLQWLGRRMETEHTSRQRIQ